MRTPELDSATEVERVVRNLLRESKAWGRYPTPIDELVEYSELAISKNIDLSRVEASFFRKLDFLSDALKKVLGLVDFRQRTIYLDQSLPPAKRAFVELHEIGHGVLPWQRELREGFADDEYTLDPELNEQFELEANHFASAALFQLEHFDDELRKLPLAFSSIRALAQRYGASIQATARRYVARCPKRCALLVLHPAGKSTSSHGLPLRNCFESPAFVTSFGSLEISNICAPSLPFVQDVHRRRKMHQQGTVTLASTAAASLALSYHFFNNSYNTFVFLFPEGESMRSRVTIIDRTD